VLLKIAWRNIWRNRRRTVIVLGSVVVGMALVLFMDAFIEGFINQTFRNQIGAHVVHMHINRAGFNDNKTVQNFLPGREIVDSLLGEHPAINAYSGRVVTFGLVNSAYNSSGISFVGVDPGSEANLTTIAESIVEGRYLGGEPNEIVMSMRTAETLQVGLGDRIVGMASSMDGSVGSDMYRVVGLYRTMLSGFDRTHVYIPLASAQRMLGLGDDISQYALTVADPDEIAELRRSFQETLGPEYEVLSYVELLPQLVLMVDVSRQSMTFIYLIIGAAMIFGIVNALLMSVFERIREFGVLMSIGMKNGRVFGMIVLEAVLIGLLGSFGGMIFGGP
jgi:putative ABC transport system permease protein